MSFREFLSGSSLYLLYNPNVGKTTIEKIQEIRVSLELG